MLLGSLKSVITSLQRSCNALLSKEVHLAGVLHQVGTETQGRAFSDCFFCKERIRLGIFSQGMTNWKVHLATKKHCGKVVDFLGGSASSDIVATVVHDKLDSKIFYKKANGVIQCLPCGKAFMRSYSTNQLLNNIRQHEGNANHIKLSSSHKKTHTLDLFFKPAKKSKTDKESSL